MIREIKTWEIRCDFPGCSAREVLHAAVQPPLPMYWGWLETHDHGMTGYSKREVRCKYHREEVK